MKSLIGLSLAMLLVNQGAFAKDTVKIKMIFDNSTTIVAELNDSNAAKDLLAKLPLSLQFNQHQNREFYTHINLNKTDQAQSEYKIGDIGYWISGSSLVLFYDIGYTDNLVIIGHITQGLKLLPQMNRTFLATIEAL